MPERVEVDLTKEERAILKRGLIDWGGPAAPTDEIARLLGFTDVQALFDEGRRIADDLQSGEALAPTDWRRALLATELVFASDLVGSGTDWSITSGFSDDRTIQLLRNVQRKLHLARALTADTAPPA